MDKLLLTISETSKLTSLGRTKLYEMAQAGELPVARFGRSIRVPFVELQTWIKTKVVSTDINA